MAHVETWYRCPACNGLYDTYKEAYNCRNSHAIRSEQWAVGKGGKAVYIQKNSAPNSLYGREWALKEADLSDNIYEREKQLEQIEQMKGK